MQEISQEIKQENQKIYLRTWQEAGASLCKHKGRLPRLNRIIPEGLEVGDQHMQGSIINT